MIITHEDPWGRRGVYSEKAQNLMLYHNRMGHTLSQEILFRNYINMN